MKKLALMVFAVVLAAVVMTGCKLVVEVPEVINSSLTNASLVLEKKGLAPYVVDSLEFDGIGKNLVCKQTPLPGSVVKRGTQVKIWISKGPTAEVEIFIPEPPVEEAVEVPEVK